MPVMKNMTIKHKLVLITMVTCIAVLLLAGTVLITLEWTNLRRTMARNLSTQAEMIADNCTAAVAFEDAKDAEETLKSLRVEPSIVLGCVRTASGEDFAHYYRDDVDSSIHPPEFQKEGRSFSGGFLTVFKGIVLDGDTIGTVCLRSDLYPMYAMLKRNTGIIIAVLLFASLAAYFVSSRLQRIISGPILNLAKVAKVVSEEKDYSARALKQTNDEVGLLIGAFNEMLEQIQQRDLALVDTNEQLEIKVQERTAKLTEEVAERKKAEESLEKLNEDLALTVQKLRQSNKELQDFAHITAHDLKAPLRAIGTLAHWISTDYANKFDKPGREKVELLVGRAERMSELIDGVLRYSEIGRTRYEEQEVDLNTLLSEVISEVGPPENIEVVVEDELPTVRCEKMCMMQIFQNLLVNAVKYMDKPEGRIKVGAVGEENFWKFGVADNGPGIEEKYFEKIFEVFQTLSTRDEVEATGIGLSIVKKIVETYGGKIWVESEVGSGSTFFFTFPKTIDAMERDRQLLGFYY